MERIKTFKQLHEEEENPEVNWRSIDWKAKGMEFEKLCPDLNVIFEDYGYEFFHQPNRTEGIASAGIIVMDDHVFVLGRMSKFPLGSLPGKNEKRKTCLMREMLDAFIFKGQLEKTLDPLVIDYANSRKSLGVSKFLMIVNRDLTDDKIVVKESPHNTVSVSIPVNMSMDEFKTQFKNYIDSRITKVDKMYIKDPLNYNVPQMVCENIKLAESVIKSVTDPKTHPVSKILDGLSEKELIETIAVMSDWLYERIDIPGYLSRKISDNNLIERIGKARKDSQKDLTRDELNEKERGLKIEELALELNKKFFPFGLNFIPNNQDPLERGKKKGDHADSIVVFPERLTGIESYSWPHSAPEKWRIQNEPSELRKLLLTIIFGDPDIDNRECKLGFGQFTWLSEKYSNLKIIPTSPEDKREVRYVEEARGPGVSIHSIKFPIELETEEIADKIFSLIIEKLKSLPLYAYTVDEDDEVESEYEYIESLFDDEVSEVIKNGLIDGI
jgi:hypothetical protein